MNSCVILKDNTSFLITYIWHRLNGILNNKMSSCTTEERLLDSPKRTESTDI